MSDTESTTGKKRTLAGKEAARDKQSSQAMPERETTEKPHAAEDIDKDKGFFGEVTEDIGEGTKMVGEKTSELADMITDKLKKGWSKACKTGAKVVDDLSQAAQGYAEKYKAESEINKMEDKKEKLISQLGHSIFKHHIAGGKVSESFFNKNETIDLFNQIEALDKKIIETGKQLDKAKE